MKLLEYADFLKDVGIDRKIIRVYMQMSEILKHIIKDDELSALEREIIDDCQSLLAEREENNADFPYAWLIVPCRDISDLNCHSLWEGVICGFFRFGCVGALEERKKWRVYSALIACILIVAYAESIQCGKVSRDDVLTYAAAMNNLAFIVSDAAFFLSSVPAIERQRETVNRRRAAKEGAAKSFKRRFKEKHFKPACIEFLAKARKRGDKAAFIREIQNDYDLFVNRAKRSGDTLGKNDYVLDDKVIAKWIKETEKQDE